MRCVWIAMLLCAGCGPAQPASQPDTPAQVWARPVASARPSPARSDARTPKRLKSAAGSPASSASSSQPVTQSPERLASTMIASLDREAAREEQERLRKREEDDARVRRAMEQLESGFGSMGVGGLGTRGGTTMGGGSGIGLGRLGTTGRGSGLGSGSGRGYGAAGRAATPPRAKAKVPPKR